MTEEEKKKYISELFKELSPYSILIINHIGHLERLYCPFYVRVIADIHLLKKGSVKAVKAVKMSIELIDVYVIDSGAYYFYHFTIIGQNKDDKPPL